MNNSKLLLLDYWASALVNILLTLFYLTHPKYRQYPPEIRERVKQRAKQSIKEELLSYSKKHLD